MAKKAMVIFFALLWLTFQSFLDRPFWRSDSTFFFPPHNLCTGKITTSDTKKLDEDTFK